LPGFDHLRILRPRIQHGQTSASSPVRRGRIRVADLCCRNRLTRCRVPKCVVRVGGTKVADWQIAEGRGEIAGGRGFHFCNPTSHLLLQSPEPGDTMAAICAFFLRFSPVFPCSGSPPVAEEEGTPIPQAACRCRFPPVLHWFTQDNPPSGSTSRSPAKARPGT